MILKYLLVLILSFQLQMASVERAHATTWFAGAMEWTQVINSFELFGINLSQAGTFAEALYSKYKEYVEKPLNVYMINKAQQELAKYIISWANGGFEGDPMILADAEKFIKDQALTQAKIALTELPAESAYSASIFNTILERYKDEDDTALRLAGLTLSAIPSIIQSNFCEDANLTSFAMNDVMREDGTYDQGELAARKTELWEYACTGNPDEDTELAAKLNDLNAQRPEIGGWDTWLATTGGDNEYTKSSKALSVMNQKTEETKETESKKVFEGEGAIGQRRCEEFLVTEDENEIVYCKKWVTLTPGEFVGSSISAALNSQIDRLTNLGSDTSWWVTLLVNLAMTRLSGGINLSLVEGGETATSTAAGGEYDQDLAEDSGSKQNLLNELFGTMDAHLESYEDLEEADRQLEMNLRNYGGVTGGVRACFQGLIDSGRIQADDPRAVTAFALVENREGMAERIRQSIIEDREGMAAMRILIPETKTRMQNSNSTEEISAIYQDFTQQVETNNYPTNQTAIERSQDNTRLTRMTRDDGALNEQQAICEEIQNSNENGSN